MTLTQRYLYALLVLMAMPSGVAADSIPAVRVSLITIYPGSEVYELYGHCELRVQDDSLDTFFNYGLFDFNAPNFVYRFVKGETDYLCGAIPASHVLLGYDGRRVVEQELDLTPAQAAQIRDALYQNARPENAVYRYKFVSDNCATRPRDIVEQVLGNSLQYHEPAHLEPTTYREMMHRYNGNYAWSRFGIDLALGAPLDTAITYRQRMFAPMQLMEAFAQATTNGHPLVKHTRVLDQGAQQGTILPPTPWWQSPLFVAILLLTITLIISWRNWKFRRDSRWFDSVLYAFAGMWGCVLFFLIFISTHEAISPNYNFLWLNPAQLLLAILPWIGSAKKALRVLHYLNALAIVLAMAIFALGAQCPDFAAFPLASALALRSIINIRQKG